MDVREPADAPGVLRVEMVCLGNICRSPSAAAVLRQRLSAAGLTDRVTVTSSGTGDWHVGHGADPRARAALAERGYPTDHTARQATPEVLAGADLVLAMDQANLRDVAPLAPPGATVALLRDYDPQAPDGAEVPDPYTGGPDGFSRVLAMVEAACDGLVEHLRRQLSGPKG